jgi:membrane-bound ClpP family serine protease
MSKIISGVVVAIALALVLAGASIRGIAAWKIALAALGLVLFIRGGLTSHRPAK